MLLKTNQRIKQIIKNIQLLQKKQSPSGT